MTAMITEIFDLFARFGGATYGEDLSLERHMLQAAARASAHHAPPSLVAAALLHDIGHCLHPDGEAAAAAGRDIGHEALGAAWLSRGFDQAVTAPIALHVEAKRYLCAVEPDYLAGLSEASRLSLVAQGGPMNTAEAAAFARRPGFAAALLLRRCDDQGKDPATPAPPLEAYRDLLVGLSRAA